MNLIQSTPPRVHVAMQSRDEHKTVYAGQIGGIPFRYVIDADGDSLICGAALNKDDYQLIVDAIVRLP